MVTLVTLAGLATIVGLIVLRPDPGVGDKLSGVTQSDALYDAEIELAELGPCAGQEDFDPDQQLLCKNIRVQLTEGPDEGEQRKISLPNDPSTPDFEQGDVVIVARSETAAEGQEYRFIDRKRTGSLFFLALVFAVAVVLLGRLRGVAALAGLVVSLLLLVRFILPSILSGNSPLWVSIIGSATIAFFALYLAHGFNFMTTTALLGTLASLGLTALLAEFFVEAAQISGFSSDEAILLKLESGVIDVAGLVLAGVVIGALGALDDVTVTQSSAVWELRAANQEMSRAELYRAGIRIGRDHIASTVNTLLLAYAGASLPLLLFFVTSDRSFSLVINEEIVTTEIVRTLVGSIGLVASVPLTTYLAALMSSDSKRSAQPSQQK